MKKRLMCVLLAAVLLLGVLAGCGGGTGSGGAPGSADPGKPGAGSTEPGKPDAGGHKDDDPVAVMQERVKAVNDAINYECIKLEEQVESGLLFYILTQPLPGPGGPESYDYDPDKPLDYYAKYHMYKAHTEGIVDEDTYVALLKNERYTGEVAASDVIETDDLYVYYGPDDPSGGYRNYCYILVKGTDIVYLFTVAEAWYKADYYGDGYYSFPESEYAGAPAPGEHPMDLSYTGDDVEYIFTSEFWRAFAQTAKFAGKADEDFKKGECINGSVSSIGRSEMVTEIPYIEEWYAGHTMSKETIRKGFEEFLENREIEAFFYLTDGTMKTYPATVRDGYEVTIDLGGDQVWLYSQDRWSGELYLEHSPLNVTGEDLPETGYSNYRSGFLVIDDFGQGGPAMLFNNGLYQYEGRGKATLIHDFSDLGDEWTDIYTDAGRTHLLFTGRGWWSYTYKLVDLKTFEVTDEVYIFYGMDDEGMNEFLEATVNGVSVDEETAWGAGDAWYTICDVYLGSREGNYTIDFDAAWGEYSRRG